MFKVYKFQWEENHEIKHDVKFYVNSKGTRNGFMHRACCIGPLPRLDSMNEDYFAYRANEDKLHKKRFKRISYINRTWEYYSGQECLRQLWSQLRELKFVDMGPICASNPFDKDNEPAYENLMEPDELFSRF